MPILDSFNRLKSDENLMLAYQAGKLSAFETLYNRHKDSLYRFFKYHSSASSSGKEQAEDLAQETWAAIINRAEHYQVSAQFKTYLFTVARSKLTDFYRRYSHLENNQQPFDTLEEDSNACGERGLSKNEPEQHLQQRQLLMQLASLPTDQKQAFILQQEGFSLREIADISHTNSETIKSRLRYAKSRLKKILQAAEVHS